MKERVRKVGTSISSNEVNGPKVDTREHIHSSFQLLYTGCHCTIGLSHPSGTPRGKERTRGKKPSSGVLLPQYPLCTEKLTYPRDSNRGFKLVVEDLK